MVDVESRISDERGEVVATAHTNIGAVAPDFDIGKIAVDAQARQRDDLRQRGKKHLVVAVEVREAYRSDEPVRLVENAAKAIEFPLGNELIAVEQDAPVAGAQFACAVLEVAMPRVG